MRFDLLGVAALLPLAAALFSDLAPADTFVPRAAAPAPVEMGEFVDRMTERKTLAEARAICGNWMNIRRRQVNGQMRLGVPIGLVQRQLGEPDYDAGGDRPLWVYRTKDGKFVAVLFCDKGKYALNAYEVSHEPDPSKGTGLSAMGPMQSMLWMSGC